MCSRLIFLSDQSHISIHLLLLLVRPFIGDNDNEITGPSKVCDVSGSDKADSDTKRSVAIRALKSNNIGRVCFRSTGFANSPGVSWLVCSYDSAPFRIRLRQVPRSAARLSQDPLLISEAFRQVLREFL